MNALIPQHGLRVLLELASVHDTEVVYRVELHARSASYRANATMSIAAFTLDLSEWEPLRGQPLQERGAPDPNMIDSATAFLRTLHKNHAALGDWPRRQLRWRALKA